MLLLIYKYILIYSGVRARISEACILLLSQVTRDQISNRLLGRGCLTGKTENRPLQRNTMNIKQFLPVLVILSSIQCMEQISTQEKQPSIEQEKALTSFPDYMYYYSAWSNIHAIKGFPLGTRATPSLYQAAQQLQGAQRKQEFINMCATLLIMEATLLKKPFEEFTVEDIRKLNAFLLHGIHPYDDPTTTVEPWYKPGIFRRGRIWVNRPRSPQTETEEKHEKEIMKPIETKIDHHNEDALELQEFLTPDEYEFYKKIYLEAPTGPAVHQKMQQMLDKMKFLYTKNGFYLGEIGSLMHVELTQIHPFCNANGRTARSLMYCLLMKEGKYPFVIIDSTFYAYAIQMADTNFAYMCSYAQSCSDKAKDSVLRNEYPYLLKGSMNTLDLTSITYDNEYYQGSFKEIEKELEKHFYSQVSTSLPVKNLSKEAYEELLQSIAERYNDLSCESDDFVQKVGDLKRFCLKQLSLSDRLCTTCDKIESTASFKFCSRCKKDLYCSQTCQKNDWSRHKTNCKAS